MANGYTYSGVRYNSPTANQVDFALTTEDGNNIPYLEGSHIHVYTRPDGGDESDYTEVDFGTADDEWQFHPGDPAIVRFNTAPGTGVDVLLRRITPYQNKYTTFNEGSLLTADQLNDGEDFSMYVDQEIYDQSLKLIGTDGNTNTEQVINTDDQKAQTTDWEDNDEKVATAGAIAFRHDNVVGDGTSYPGEGNQGQHGKLRIDDTSVPIKAFFWDNTLDTPAWVELYGGEDDTTYTFGNTSVESGAGARLRLTGSDGSTNDVTVRAGANITLTGNEADGFTINSAQAAGLVTASNTTALNAVAAESPDEGETVFVIDATNLDGTGEDTAPNNDPDPVVNNCPTGDDAPAGGWTSDLNAIVAWDDTNSRWEFVRYMAAQPDGRYLILDAGDADQAVTGTGDVTFAGNVGIGTAAPRVPLDVHRTSPFDSSDGRNTNALNLTLASGGTAGAGNYSTGLTFSKINSDRPGSAIVGVQTDGENELGLAFLTHQASGVSNALVEQMRIDSSGKVGIGETDPATNLHIDTANILGTSFTGTTDGEGVKVSLTNHTSGNYVSLLEGSSGSFSNPLVRIGALYDNLGSRLIFGTSDEFASGITNTALTISHNGNVGINKPNPSATLHIASDDENIVRLQNTTGFNDVAGTAPVSDILYQGQRNGVVGNLGRIRLRQSGTWSASGSTPHLKPTALEFMTQDATSNDVSDTARMTIDPAGNVGIGVADPSARLEINTPVVAGEPTLYLNRLADQTNTSDIALRANAVIRSEDSIKNVVNTNGFFTWNIGGNDSKAGMTGATAEVVRIDSAGKVGVGATPDTRTHFIIEGAKSLGGSNESCLRVNPTFNRTSSGGINGANCVISTGGVQTVFSPEWVNNFRAGPITSSDDQTIGSLVGYMTDSAFGSNSAATNAYGFYGDISSASDTRWNFYAGGSAPNYFKGTVYINASTTDPVPDPITTDARLSVKTGRSTVTPGIEVIASAAEDTATSRILMSFATDGRDASPDDPRVLGSLTKNQDNTLTLNLGAGGTVTPASDYRLKENIAPVADAITAVKALNPVTYDFKKGPDNQVGFIAHELQEIVPSAVTGTKDEETPIGKLLDAEGNLFRKDVPEPEASEMTYEEQELVTPYVAGVAAVIDEETNEVITPAVEEQEAVYETVTKQRTWEATGTRPVYQGVDQTKLIPLLTKALQEALERIEVLEGKLAAS